MSSDNHDQSGFNNKGEPSLFEVMPQLGWMANPDGWITYYNRRWYEYTGTTPEQMEGWGWQSIHDPTLLPAVLERWRTSIATGEPFEMPFPLRRYDGVFRWFLTRVVPFRDSDGSIVRWVGINTDIDDQRSAQEALRVSEEAIRESEERFRHAITEAPIPMMIHDEDDKILAMSAGWTHASGYAFDDIPTVTDWTERAYGTRQAFVKDYIDKLFAIDKTTSNGEWTIRAKDGKERIWDFFTTPLRRSASARRLLLSLAVDVTERKRAEENFRALVERLPDPIWVQRDGKFVYVNAAFVAWSGVDAAKEIVGQSISDRLVHPDDRARMQERFAADKHAKSTPALSVRMLRGDGSVRIMETTGIRLDFDGEPANVVIGRDVTERTKEIEARLALSDRMAAVGTLAAGVAHEINNPLAYVMSNLDLIAEGLLALSGGLQSRHVEELTEMVNEARQGADRVRRIVRGLKTFSRADEERRVPLDVRAVLDLSINMAFNEIKHRARLVKDYGDIPSVEADEARLGQVFINLLVNAAHATPEGHADKNEIRIVTKTDSFGRVVVEVRDTGRGISPEALPRIFDPFFTTKAIGEGTGLGLSICHGIVTGLGGEITAESDRDRGAVFRVVLPPARLETTAAAEAKLAQSSRPAVAARRGRVLVVDDDPMVAGTLRRVLDGEHDVTIVTDGKEALDLLLGRTWFDVILCDLMMPSTTGMELYAQLLRALPEIVERMVFVTGGAFTPGARAFLDAVPNQRLEKPFSPQNVRALVRGFIR